MFALLLVRQGETKETSWEVGYRLGQASEFSLLVSYVALSTALLSTEAAHIIQGVAVWMQPGGLWIGRFTTNPGKRITVYPAERQFAWGLR